MPVLPHASSLAVSVRANPLVFEDPKSSALLDQIRAVAPSHGTVLITGETGTGKELVARHVHELSERAERPFLAVNQLGLPEYSRRLMNTRAALFISFAFVASLSGLSACSSSDDVLPPLPAGGAGGAGGASGAAGKGGTGGTGGAAAGSGGAAAGPGGMSAGTGGAAAGTGGTGGAGQTGEAGDTAVAGAAS